MNKEQKLISKIYDAFDDLYLSYEEVELLKEMIHGV